MPLSYATSAWSTKTNNTHPHTHTYIHTPNLGALLGNSDLLGPARSRDRLGKVGLCNKVIKRRKKKNNNKKKKKNKQKKKKKKRKNKV